MHFAVRSFLGHTDELSWSQYWENEPDDTTLVHQRGHLFALINLQVDDGLASDVGHLLINEINQTYFSSIEVPSTAWLKRTLETIFHNHRAEVTSISLTVAIVLNDQLFLAILHQGIGVLQRGPKISQISSGVKNEVKLISGKLQNQDQLLLCTPDFLKRFTWDKIKQNLSLKSIQDTEESFLLDLSSIDDQQSVAGVLIQIHQDIDLEDSAVAPPIQESTPSDSATPSHHRRPTFNIFKNLFKSRPVFVSHLETSGHQHRKKINIIFAVLVMAALFVSISIGAKQNKTQQIEKQYQALKVQFETKINNATAMKNVSLDSAQSLAKEAKDIIQSMVALEVHSQDVSKMTASVDALLSKTGSADVYQPDLFYDTNLIGGSAVYKQLYFGKSYLYLLDPSSGRIDRLDIGNKSIQKILTANVSPGIETIAENNDIVYVLKNKQIFEIKTDSLTSKIDLSKEVENFSSGTFHFWNGAIYLLSNNSDIWKFTPNSTGFSPGSVWLKEGEMLPEFTQSFAINGEVWVINKTGTIVPYTRGARDQFKSKNNTVTQSANNLVTSPDSKVLAFTDNDNLIYIYGKDGLTADVINFGNLKISSMALSGSTNTLYVLCTDQKIYKISL